MSVVSDILTEIKTRLETVTTGNGYSQNVGTVVIPHRYASDITGNYNVSIRAGDIEQDAELSCPGNPPRIAWVLPVVISGMVSPSDASTTGIDVLIAEFGTDLQTSITANAATWHTFDNNAINAELGPLQFSETDEGDSKAAFELRITYRVQENAQNTITN